MCTVGEDNSVQERCLRERLARELTANEQQQAAAIEAARLPEILERVKRRDAQIEAAAACLFAAIAGSLWLWRRQVTCRLWHVRSPWPAAITFAVVSDNALDFSGSPRRRTCNVNRAGGSMACSLLQKC
jgi:hypothetical protein